MERVAAGVANRKHVVHVHLAARDVGVHGLFQRADDFSLLSFDDFVVFRIGQVNRRVRLPHRLLLLRILRQHLCESVRRSAINVCPSFSFLFGGL